MLEPARGGQHPSLESQRKKPTRSGEEEKRSTKRLRFSDTPMIEESAPSAPSQGYIKTRHCPACESGMNAPGIRHSATCRRVNQPVQVAQPAAARADDYPDMDVEDVHIPQETEFVERSKRHREHDDEALETQMKRERRDELFEIFGEDLSLGMFWEAGKLLSSQSLPLWI